MGMAMQRVGGWVGGRRLQGLNERTNEQTNGGLVDGGLTD